MRVKLGSVAFLKAASGGYGIGLDDNGHLIEFLGDWRTLEALQDALVGPEPVYLEVEGLGHHRHRRRGARPAHARGHGRAGAFVRSALGRLPG